MVLYLALGATAVAWVGLRGQANIWQSPSHADPQVLASIVAGLALGLAIVFASRMALYRFDWARALHREFRNLLYPMTDIEIVILAVASSLGEELFFRGALLPVIGVLGSSAVFALLHVGPKARHLPWTVGSFGAGLAFGAIFVWTGDLTGPVLAHFLVNFLNLRHVAQVEVR
jgi:membrane protease YdiL (CAAX protease family)